MYKAFFAAVLLANESPHAAPPIFPTVCVSGRREELSQALGNDPKAPLPKDNVFAVQNYHQGSSAQDPGEGV